MNLKVNSVNFQGKKEILYGLTKAAQSARKYETNQIAYIASRIQMRKYEEQAFNEGKITSYLDMVINDSEFLLVAKNVQGKDLSSIKKLLAPFQTDHGTVEPIKIFESVMNDVINASYRRESIIIRLAKNLLSKLKS